MHIINETTEGRAEHHLHRLEITHMWLLRSALGPTKSFIAVSGIHAAFTEHGASI